MRSETEWRCRLRRGHTFVHMMRVGQMCVYIGSIDRIIDGIPAKHTACTLYLYMVLANPTHDRQTGRTGRTDRHAGQTGPDRPDRPDDRQTDRPTDRQTDTTDRTEVCRIEGERVSPAKEHKSRSIRSMYHGKFSSLLFFPSSMRESLRE